MSAPPSVVDSVLGHDDDTVGVRDLPEGEPIGFGEGLPRMERRGVSEDKLSVKEGAAAGMVPLGWGTGLGTRGLISGHIQIPLPEIWF